MCWPLSLETPSLVQTVVLRCRLRFFSVANCSRPAGICTESSRAHGNLEDIFSQSNSAGSPSPRGWLFITPQKLLPNPIPMPTTRYARCEADTAIFSSDVGRALLFSCLRWQREPMIPSVWYEETINEVQMLHPT
jgi:hypothetical protein